MKSLTLTSTEQSQLSKLAAMLLLALLAMMATTAGARAATIHVAKWGEDAKGCGSSIKPCLTIQNAIDLAGADSLVIVQPGEYVERLEIRHSGLRLESSAGRNATAISQPAIVPEPARFEDLYLVHVSASRVRIGRRGRGFTLSYTTLYGIVARALGENERLNSGWIEGNSLVPEFTLETDNEQWPEVSVSGKNMQVRYNTIGQRRIAQNANNDGAGLGGSGDNLRFFSNKIYSYGDDPVDSYDQFGLLVGGGTSGGAVIGNVILGDAVGSEDDYSGGIQIGQRGISAVIANNVVSGFDTGIDVYLASPQQITVSSNIVADNSKAGIALTDDDEDPGAQGAITNNLIVNTSSAAIESEVAGHRSISGNTIIQADLGLDVAVKEFKQPLADVSVLIRDNSTYATTSAGIQNSGLQPLTYQNHYFGNGIETRENPGALSGTTSTQPGPLNVNAAAGL